MPKYAAFLRAINVGGHTVKMDHLRRLFEELGLLNVETVIASGNVIFDSPSKNALAMESKIEKHLHQALGYEVATFIRSTAELAQLIAYKPFKESELSKPDNGLHIAFLEESPGNDAEKKLIAFITDDDQFHFHGREMYWLRRGRTSDSEFSGAVLEKALGMQATMRNSTTVRKIAAKYL